MEDQMQTEEFRLSLTDTSLSVSFTFSVTQICTQKSRTGGLTGYSRSLIQEIVIEFLEGNYCMETDLERKIQSMVNFDDWNEVCANFGIDSGSLAPRISSLDINRYWDGFSLSIDD